MKDFTASSMTQSFASVTSLPRDVSCEDFDSSTGDKTVTEDFNQQVCVLGTSMVLMDSYHFQDTYSHSFVKTGRFCLDSSKLEEIEALTDSPPLSEQIEVPQLSSETSELDAALCLKRGAHPPARTEYQRDSVSHLLNERTESLLQRKGSKRNKKMSNVSSIIPEKAKYCTEEEMILENDVPVSRRAWLVQNKSEDPAEFIDAVSSIPRKEIANNQYLERRESLVEMFDSEVSYAMTGADVGSKSDHCLLTELDGPVASSLIQHKRELNTEELTFHPEKHRVLDKTRGAPDIQSPVRTFAEQNENKGSIAQIYANLKAISCSISVSKS